MSFRPTPVQLTNGPERKKYPQFSPNGKHLAFLVSAGTATRLRVIDLRTRKITDLGLGDDILWCHDSKRIVSRDSKELFTVAIADGARKKLVSDSKVTEGSMQWHRTRQALSLFYIHNENIWKVGVRGTSAVGAPKELTEAEEFYPGVTFSAVAVDPRSKAGQERFIGILDYAALSVVMSNKGVLYVPEQKPVELGNMSSIYWPAAGGYIYGRNGSLFQKSGGAAAKRIAGNGAGEPTLARDGWLYYSAYQPERKTSGGAIRPKYGEIHRVRLTSQ